MVYVYGLFHVEWPLLKNIPRGPTGPVRATFSLENEFLHKLRSLIRSIARGGSLNSYRSLSMGLAARGFPRVRGDTDGQSFCRSRSWSGGCLLILLLSGLSLCASTMRAGKREKPPSHRGNPLLGSSMPWNYQYFLFFWRHHSAVRACALPQRGPAVA